MGKTGGSYASLCSALRRKLSNSFQVTGMNRTVYSDHVLRETPMLYVGQQKKVTLFPSKCQIQQVYGRKVVILPIFLSTNAVCTPNQMLMLCGILLDRKKSYLSRPFLSRISILASIRPNLF